MGKNKRPQSSNFSMQNGYMNKILHALDRRQRWQNVRKVLPNKRQGSGKHIIDEGNGETTTNTSQPLEVHGHLEKNKHAKNEQETTETRSKKFRIRSLISNEMAKRRGKTNSLKETKNDPHPQSETQSLSGTKEKKKKKKRKCDICAAMLTMSYLRQKGLANKNNMVIEDENQQPVDAHHRSTTGLTKSFSFPLLEPTKTRDFELQQLKHKLRDLKDIQVTKDRFILPMNQWKDVGFPKPMLTRPESFTGSVSQKEKKTLKQKIGFVFKVDARNKEKRRILMDAVFHKIPYGRKSSKDPKKVLKTTSTANKTHDLIKTSSSTGEAMSKYHKLLSQTSTRDKLVQHSSADHNTKLFIVGDHSSSEKSTHKRIRSLPDISPYDFMHNQESLTMDIHLSITGTIFDDQRSSGHFETYSGRRNIPESIAEETNLFKINEDVDEHPEVGTDTSNKINHQNKTEAATIETGSKPDFSLVEKDEAIQENLYDYQEQNDHQRQLVDEDLNSSDHPENTDRQKVPRVAIEVENDKSFNEILGMFKKVSDERTKFNNEIESRRVLVRKVGKNTLVDKKQVSQTTLDHQEINKNEQVSQKTMDHQEKYKSGSEHWIDQGFPKNQKILEHNEEDPSPLSSSHEVDKDNVINTLDHQEKESLKTSCSENEWATQDSTQLEDEKKQYRFSINDADEKRPNSIKEAAYDGETIKNRLLLELVSDKAEFQFVKQVLDKSGFLLGFGEWYQPMDLLLFEEVETCFLQAKYLDSIKEEEVKINDHHLLLFDLVNEALLEIHNTTHTYCPHPLTTRSKLSPMPVGYRLLEQVWVIVNMYLSWSLDDAVSRDLAKGNGWMNLQADAEFVGMQLEDLLVDDLLDELVFDDLLM